MTDRDDGGIEFTDLPVTPRPSIETEWRDLSRSSIEWGTQTEWREETPSEPPR